jgi:hypothetical protein
VAVASEQADALAVPLDDQSIAIMLDLVNPIVPCRNRGAPDRDAGFERSLTDADLNRPGGVECESRQISLWIWPLAPTRQAGSGSASSWILS